MRAHHGKRANAHTREDTHTHTHIRARAGNLFRVPCAFESSIHVAVSVCVCSIYTRVLYAHIKINDRSSIYNNHIHIIYRYAMRRARSRPSQPFCYTFTKDKRISCTRARWPRALWESVCARAARGLSAQIVITLCAQSKTIYNNNKAISIHTHAAAILIK